MEDKGEKADMNLKNMIITNIWEIDFIKIRKEGEHT